LTESLEQEIRTLRSRFWSDRDPDGRGFAPLADAYRRSGDLEQALELLRDGLDRHPDFSTGHVVAGLVYRSMEDPSRAMQSFERVLALDPRNHVAIREVEELGGVSADPEGAGDSGSDGVWELSTDAGSFLDEGPNPADAATAEILSADLDDIELPVAPDFGEHEADAESALSLDDIVLDGPVAESDPFAGNESDLSLDDFARDDIGPPTEAGDAAGTPFDDTSFGSADPLEIDDSALDLGGIVPGEDESESDSLPEAEFDPWGDLEDEGEEAGIALGNDAPELDMAIPGTEVDSPEPTDEPVEVEAELAIEDPAEAPMEVEAVVDLADPGEEPVEAELELPEPAAEPAESEVDAAPADPPPVDEAPVDEAPADEDPADEDPDGDLYTRTMGELYVRQGLHSRAVEVYEHLLECDPENVEFRDRLNELREIAAGSGAGVAAPAPVARTLHPPDAEDPEVDDSDDAESLAPQWTSAAGDEPEMSTPFAWEDTDEPESTAAAAVADRSPISGYFRQLLSWSPGAVPVETLAPDEADDLGRRAVPIESLAPDSPAGSGRGTAVPIESLAPDSPAGGGGSAAVPVESLAPDAAPPVGPAGDSSPEDDEFQDWLSRLRT
jgi:tetratricopeptide (TPR) repeat protein